MSDALRQQLQTSLGAAYTLQRELGGGGMSRVFVARDEALGRDVVVKVLAPELAAGISSERFAREIRLAAALQQANIVPVLAAGVAHDGLPYFTMPFVEGESLRHRLGEGPLPVGEALAVLRDVAKALAYAHARGIIHRDIKPDNVLLSGGTAVVADFGIAKALGAARTTPDGARTTGGALTALGTALGTPAYMAPEQAAGDPDADHRLDLYAFGCLAYELLAGVPPFHNLAPQRLLAAHMAERPRPVQELRADTPPPLAALVARCLEKDPAARPASAEEVLRTLDAMGTGASAVAPALLAGSPGAFRRALLLYAVAFVAVAALAKAAVVATGVPDWVFPGALIVMGLGLPLLFLTGYAQRVARHAAAATPTFTPGGSPATNHGTMVQLALKASPHLSWRRVARTGAVSMGAFALLVAGFMTLRAQGIGPFGALLAAGDVGPEPLLLTEFVTVQADSSLGAVLAQAVRANLEQSSAVRVLTPAALTAALGRMQRPPTTRVDLALAREVAQREGLRVIVDGQIAGIGTGFLVTLRLVSADSARELASFHEAAADPKELIAVVDRLSRKLRGRIGESLRDVRASPPLSRVTTPSLDALRKYTESLQANAAGQGERQIALAREAIALDSSFALAWRSLAEGMLNARYPRAAVDSVIARAYALRDRLTERERHVVTAEYFGNGPGRDRARAITAYEAAFALGDRENTSSLGNLLVTRREFARAESLAQVRLALEPANVYAIMSLPGFQLLDGRTAAAESTLATLGGRMPAFEGRYIGSLVAYARGDERPMTALLDSLREVGDDAQRSDASWSRSRLMLRRGQLRQSAALLAGADSGATWATVEDAVESVWNDAWFLGPSPRHARLLDSLAASPGFTALAPVDRPYIYLASTYARVGRPDRARAMLARLRTEVPDTAFQRVEQPAVRRALGEIALAEGRPLDAVAEFRRGDQAPDGPANECGTCLAVNLARAYDAAGNADSTIAALERYLGTSPAVRFMNGTDARYLAPFTKRLGELYEARGDVARALVRYREFVALWTDADPELQPTVAEVRRRVEALEAREARAR